jgi:hypothetical protein
MGQPDDADEMLRLAARLRREATRSGRADVVAKVDELVVVIAGDRAPAPGKATAIMQFLDGLGF